MKIEFDPAKDVLNREKHGISLAAAAEVEWDTVYAIVDDRNDYSETRMIGLGYIGLRLYCVVFVDRDDTRRIISLRKANRREVKRYAEA